MSSVGTLKIRDKNTDQDAFAFVRTFKQYVMLSLSLEHDGDVEVSFTPAECRELVSLLQQAIEAAQEVVAVA